MTNLRSRKTTVKTTTEARVNRRSIVVELHPERPHEIYIREARCRSGYWVPYLAIYHLGAKLAERERKELKRGRRVSWTVADARRRKCFHSSRERGTAAGEGR